MFQRKPQDSSKLAPSVKVGIASPENVTAGAPIDRPDDVVSPEDGIVVIGKGARVSGSIADCRKLEVCGILEADVVADLVVIRHGGGLKGEVRTTNAQVHGILDGSLTVHGHLEICATGEVSGDVTYGTFSVATGAKVQGAIQTRSVLRDAERPVELPDDLHVENGLNNGANGTLQAPNGVPMRMPTPVVRPLLRH